MWRARNGRVRWRIRRFPEGPQSVSHDHHVILALPPCDPGGSVFPNPVLTLVQPRRSPSQAKRSLSVDPHTPRVLPVYFQGRSIVRRPYVLLVRLLLKHQVPRAPSRTQGVTSRAVAACSTSAGVTPPSSLLLAHAPILSPPAAYGQSLGQRVCAGCDQPLLDIGPSQRYLHESFPRCLDPYPGGPHGARTRFFPQGIGLPHLLSRTSRNQTG